MLKCLPVYSWNQWLCVYDLVSCSDLKDLLTAVRCRPMMTIWSKSTLLTPHSPQSYKIFNLLHYTYHTKKLAWWKQDDTYYTGWFITKGNSLSLRHSWDNKNTYTKGYFSKRCNNLNFLFLTFLLPILSFGYQRDLKSLRKKCLPLNITAGWWRNLCSDTGSCRERVRVC